MPASQAPEKPALEDVVAWMKGKAEREGCLYQADVAGDIQRKFGEDFVHHNDAGNLAIRKPVLAAFRKATPGFVWDPAQKMWRRRIATDGKGRQTQG